MNPTHFRQLAAGQLYDKIGHHPHLDHIVIDGERVGDPRAAHAAYLRNIVTASHNPLVRSFDRLVERAARPKPIVDAETRAFQAALRPTTKARFAVVDKIGRVKNWVTHTRIGRPVGHAIGHALNYYQTQDPERIHHQARAEIVLKDGTRAAFLEDVDDAKATLALKHAAVVPQLLALFPGMPIATAMFALKNVIPHTALLTHVEHYLPFNGSYVTGGGAALALGAAAIAGSYAGAQALFGKSHQAGALPYAKAFVGASGKQVLLSAAHFAPFGALIFYAILAYDAKAIRALTTKPSP
jgi:hypothetical protein